MYMHILTLWFGYTLVDYNIAISRENTVTYPEPEIGVATCKNYCVLWFDLLIYPIGLELEYTYHKLLPRILNVRM